jgi:hypothetical protein
MVQIRTSEIISRRPLGTDTTQSTMSKRKRNSEPTLQDQLTKSQDDLFRALKAAKGFERQRLSKRLHEAGITPDKQERLEREVAVLKVRSHI